MTSLKALTAAAIALAVPAGAAFVAPGTAPPASAAAAPAAAPAFHATGEPVQVGPSVGGLTVHDSRDEPEREPRVLGTFSDRGRAPAGFEVDGGSVLADRGHTAGAVAGADDLSGGPWCNVQCITKGVAYEHGTGVEIVVETSVQAQILVTVVRDVDDDGVPDLIGSANTPGLDTQLHWVLEDLEPGATYHGMATATDIYGNTSYAWGHVTMP